MAFSPDGLRLVVDVGTVYVHDPGTLEPVGGWKARYATSTGLAWSPDGRLLARTDTSPTARVSEVATGTSAGPVRVWDVG